MYKERDYTDEEVIEFIENEFSNNNPVSLREIARHFNTSHAQIKRILIRQNYYDEYLRRKEDIIILLEKKDNEEGISIYSYLKDKRKEEVEKDDIFLLEDKKANKILNNKDRYINTDISITEDDLTKIYVEYEKKIKEKKDLPIPALKVGFITDIHLGHHNQQALNIALTFLKEMEIDLLILGGDILDNDSISFWGSSSTLTFKEEIEMTREFQRQLREFLGKDIRMVWLESNHEFIRLKRYLNSNAKELQDLPELNFENLMQFEKFNIEYIPTTEYLKRYNKPFSIGQLNFIHGNEIKSSFNVVNVARTLFLKAHDNIMFGHYHTCQEYIQRDIRGNVKGAWAVGCLANLTPSYSPVNNWVNGFAYIEFFKDGSFAVYNKKIIDNKIL